MSSDVILSSKINDSYIGQKVHMRGRIYHKELSDDNKIIYFYIRDDIGLFTVSFERDSFIKIYDLPLETFVEIIGTVQENEKPSLTKYVISGILLELLSQPSDDIEELRSYLPSIRFLYIRRPEIKALLLLKRHIQKYIVLFLEEHGFQPVETPIITSFTQINRQAMRVSTNRKNDISELEKFLIQKSQFYLEALGHAFGKAYTLTPAFRADHRESNLLLAEFWLVEVEELFSTVMNNMDLLESLIKFVTNKLIERHTEDIRNLFIYRALSKLHSPSLKICNLNENFWISIDDEIKQHLNFLYKIISKRNFPRLKYKDIVMEFQKNGDYFETSHLRERRGKILTVKYDSPVFVTDFPFALRHFYDKKNPQDPSYTLTFDLIGHGTCGEIASGSEREFRADIVNEQMKEKKLRKDNNQTLQWYYKLQRFGSVPHSGFSIGLERLTAWLTKTENITDIVAFPRRIVGNEISY